MGQDISDAPNINIGDFALQVVEDFTYLGSTISNSLSLEPELNKRIGKAAAVMARLSKRVWENNKLTISTKIAVYRACILSTLLYGSESWTTYSHQENRLNSFHLRSLRRILHISSKDHITKYACAALATTSTVARPCPPNAGWLHPQGCPVWRPTGCVALRFKDVCKCNIKKADIDTNTWETTAADRNAWRQTEGKVVPQQKQRELKDGQKKEREGMLEQGVISCSLQHPYVTTAIGTVTPELACTAIVDIAQHRTEVEYLTQGANPLSSETEGADDDDCVLHCIYCLNALLLLECPDDVVVVVVVIHCIY